MVPGEKHASVYDALTFEAYKAGVIRAKEVETTVRAGLTALQFPADLQDLFISFLPEILAYSASTGEREHIPDSIRAAVLSVGVCLFCGATENLSIDHILPFSLGGNDDIENLQCLCMPCNIRKSNKIVS